MRASRALAAAFVLASLASPVLSLAQAAGKSEAEELYQEGLDFYKQGKYEQALQSFDGAEKLVPNVGNVYNIARCLHMLGRLPEAIAKYEEYIAKGGPKKDKVQKYIEEIRKTPAQVMVKTNPDGAQILVDGKSQPAGTAPITLKLAPGKHVIEAVSPGYGWRSVELEVAYADVLIYSIDIAESAVPDEDVPVVSGEEPVEESEEVEAEPGSLHGEDLGNAEVEVVSARRPEISNLLLAGAGVAFPIVFDEVFRFVSVDVSWELGIGPYFGIGLGVDMQVAANGQLYAPYLLVAFNLALPKGFALFARLGGGAAFANAPSRSYVAGSDAAPYDFLVRLDVGASWSIMGFTLRVDALSMNLLLGPGSVTEDFAGQYVPRLLVGYSF
jgi:hypothetical protein